MSIWILFQTLQFLHLRFYCLEADKECQLTSWCSGTSYAPQFLWCRSALFTIKIAPLHWPTDQGVKRKIMGTYVHYSLGREDGIKDTVMEKMQSFVFWLHEIEKKYPGDYGADLINMAEKLAKYRDLELIVNLEEARLVDRVVDELVHYCDMERIKLFNEITHSMHKWYRYASSLDDVVLKCTQKGSAYYKKIFSGCSIVDLEGHQYKSDDGVYHLSWLLPHEVSDFRADLESYDIDFSSNDDYIHGVYCILESLKKAEKENVSLVIEIA